MADYSAQVFNPEATENKGDWFPNKRLILVAVAVIVVIGIVIAIIYICYRMFKKRGSDLEVRYRKSKKNPNSRQKVTVKESSILIESDPEHDCRHHHFCYSATQEETEPFVKTNDGNENKYESTTDFLRKDYGKADVVKPFHDEEEARSVAVQTNETLQNSAYRVCILCSDGNFLQCPYFRKEYGISKNVISTKIHNGENIDHGALSQYNHLYLSPEAIRNLSRNKIDVPNILPVKRVSSIPHFNQTRDLNLHREVNFQVPQASMDNAKGHYNSRCLENLAVSKTTQRDKLIQSENKLQTAESVPRAIKSRGVLKNVTNDCLNILEDRKLHKLRQQLCVNVSGLQSCKTNTDNKIKPQLTKSNVKSKIKNSYSSTNQYGDCSTGAFGNKQTKTNTVLAQTSCNKAGKYSQIKSNKFTQTQIPKRARSLSTQTTNFVTNKPVYKDCGVDTPCEISYNIESEEEGKLCKFWRELPINISPRKRNAGTQVRWISPTQNRTPFTINETMHRDDNYSAWRNHQTRLQNVLPKKMVQTEASPEWKNEVKQNRGFNVYRERNQNKMSINRRPVFPGRLKDTFTQVPDFIPPFSNHLPENLNRTKYKNSSTRSFGSLDDLSTFNRRQNIESNANRNHNGNYIHCSPVVPSRKCQSVQTDDTNLYEDNNYVRKWHRLNAARSSEKQNSKKEILSHPYKTNNYELKKQISRTQDCKDDNEKINAFSQNETLRLKNTSKDCFKNIALLNDRKKVIAAVPSTTKPDINGNVSLSCNSMPLRKCPRNVYDVDSQDNESDSENFDDPRVIRKQCQFQSKPTVDSHCQDNFYYFKDQKTNKKNPCKKSILKASDLQNKKASQENHKQFLETWAGQNNRHFTEKVLRAPKECESSSDTMGDRCSPQETRSDLSLRTPDPSQSPPKENIVDVGLENKDKTTSFQNIIKKETLEGQTARFQAGNTEENSEFANNHKCEVLKRIRGMYSHIDSNTHEANGNVVQQVKQFLKAKGKWKYQN